MPDMVQNAVDRANAEVEKIKRDRDAAELACLREKVKRLEANSDQLQKAS